MQQIRKSSERGYFDHGWLKSFHTFSFADYYDPQFMGFRSLRVINQDVVTPGTGFGTHPHKDMEIITYILEGELEHKDSMGNGSVIKAGDIQYMSAGTGVQHSEFNPSAVNPVHLLQIWIMPHTQRLAPRYAQKFWSREEKLNQLRLLVSEEGNEQSLAIRQHALLFASILQEGKTLHYPLPAGRYAWLQVARGNVLVNEQLLNAGDAIAIASEEQISIKGVGPEAEFLLFDLE